MKKLLILLTLVAVAYIAINRQRLFLRDPLAKMFVDDVKVDGAQVFINYSNDVLVLQEKVQPLIVQNWDKTPGTIQVLPCLHSLACLTQADQAPKFALPIKDPQTTMTNREVDFRDESGKSVRVTLR